MGLFGMYVGSMFGRISFGAYMNDLMLNRPLAQYNCWRVPFRSIVDLQVFCLFRNCLHYRKRLRYGVEQEARS